MPLPLLNVSALNLFKNYYYIRPTAPLVMPISSKARARKPSEEIVDDSEPERAELRRRQRKSSAESPTLSFKSTKRASTPFPNPSFYTHIPDVIEISDSDSEPSCSHSHVMKSDPSSHIQSSVRYVSPTNIPKPSIGIGACADDGSLSTTGGQPLSSNLSNDQGSMTPSASKKTLIDARRFAYVSTTTNKKPTTLPPKRTDTTAVPPKRKNPSFDLPNVDLSKVSRCVCCEVSWTVRKSGPQKLSHIRACAKKHVLTEETILLLLQKEVLGYIKPPKQTSKTQANTPAFTEAGPSKKTYLEELVDVPPKKKTKQREAENMLSSISVTRDSILARAHGILNNPSSNGFETIAKDSIRNDFSQGPFVDAGNGDIPPSTQAFGHSDLAHHPGLASRTSLFNINTSPVRPDVHSGEAAHRSIHTQQRSLDEPFDLLGTRLLPHDLPISQKDVRSHMTSHQLEHPGILNFENLSNLCNICLTTSTPSLTKKDRKKERPLPSPRPSLDDALARLTLETTPQKAKKPTKPRTRKKAVRLEKTVFGAEWEAHMKMHILRDSELHLQILRYQPIHFNVFLEFAKLYAPLSSKLKLQLQIFLDQQAILFFGGNTWKR